MFVAAFTYQSPVREIISKEKKTIPTTLRKKSRDTSEKQSSEIDAALTFDYLLFGYLKL